MGRPGMLKKTICVLIDCLPRNPAAILYAEVTGYSRLTGAEGSHCVLRALPRFYHLLLVT